MKKITYNHGTGNVGVNGRLVATLQHVQFEDSKQSYYNLQWNNYKEGMSTAEHLDVMYNGSVGFKNFDDAMQYLTEKLEG